jgi:hypothetical protein
MPRQIEHADVTLLVALGEEVVALLHRSDFTCVAEEFGYARALGRPSAKALEQDLAISLGEAGATRLREAPASIRVLGYEPTSRLPLVAIVECRMPSDGGDVLLELVVTVCEGAFWVMVEDISV